MKKRILLLLTIILGLGISLGAVYFMYYKKDERLSNLTTGLIKLDFKEKSNVIDLDNEVPVPDTVGVQKRPYAFTIKNISQKTINLNIKVDVKENTNIPLGAVRYGVFINDKLVKKDYIHDDKILYSYEELLVDETIECKLRFWIDYYYDWPEKEFEALIQIEGDSRDTGSEEITVTFDANGGTVDTTTKQVAVGENYGRLPTPTREGYTFMGWNGKNLLNKKDSIIEGIRNETETIGWASTAFDNSWVVNTLKPTFEYTISYNIKCIDIPYHTDIYSNNLGFYLFNGTSSSLHWMMSYYIQKDESLEFNRTFITPLDVNNPSANYNIFVYTNLYLDNDTTVNSKVEFSNIQLEEGTKATEYEPYYITSNTKVVQSENHTLKAIWKENS